MTETSKEPRVRLLIVDDDEVFRGRLAIALESRAIECLTAADADTAFSLAASARPDWVLLDLRMPRVSGLDAIPEIRRLLPGARIIVLTGFGSIATAVEAVRRGATDYLSKPVDADGILAAFEREAADSTTAPPVERETPSLDFVEWEHIQRVLRECDGNISQAARRLGMHRRSLQRKLGKFPPRA